MEGPMDKMFGHSAFDLNNDGKISGAEWAFIDEVLFNEDKNYDCMEDDELDELESAGLDRDELEFMDDDERRQALEDAGLDPDDYDD